MCIRDSDKSLYIEFAALYYDASTFANYYYRLKGFDDKWIKVPANRRQAAYTNLRPGNYTFELRYACLLYTSNGSLPVRHTILRRLHN